VAVAQQAQNDLIRNAGDMNGVVFKRFQYNTSKIGNALPI